MTTDSDAEPRSEERFGQIVVSANLAGTILFAVTAICAATFFTTPLQWIGAITAMCLFAIGIVTFLWSYYNAVQRSRHEEISVLQLYLLSGSTAPRWVRWRMWGAITAQIAIAVSTALARPNGPDGNPGSSLAVGVLVPMFGLGLNGLWAAFHGQFAPRQLTPSAAGTRDDQDVREGIDDVDDEAMAANDDSIDKNAEHG